MATVINRFSTYKNDFKKDLGIDWTSNKDLYVQYYNARVTDELCQISFLYLGEIERDVELIKKFTDPANQVK